MNSRSSVKTRAKETGSTLSVSSATRPTVARFEQRRKADRRRRILKVALVFLLVAALAAAGWALWFSSWFTVTRVHVVGAHRVPAAKVESAAHVPMGRPILRVDTAAIRRGVAGIADLSSVTVTTQWPHTVIITVVERKPVAVVRIPGGSYRLLDATGVDLGGVEERPDGMPLLSMQLAGTPRATLAAAAAAASSLPAKLAAKVSWVTALTPDSVVLELKSGATVRWGDATQGAVKAQVLIALMKRHASIYDVSAPYAPTTARG